MDPPCPLGQISQSQQDGFISALETVPTRYPVRYLMLEVGGILSALDGNWISIFNSVLGYQAPNAQGEQSLVSCWWSIDPLCLGEKSSSGSGWEVALSPRIKRTVFLVIFSVSLPWRKVPSHRCESEIYRDYPRPSSL
jgi:hypothetical protein